MAQNAAIDRNAGAGGFDWAIHQYDTVGGDDDLEINQQLAGVPIQLVVNRDRWQETEADSGSNFNDLIKGDALERIVGGFGFTGCDALDPAGVNRITGLGDYVTTFPTSLADVKAVAAAGDCPLTGAPDSAANPVTGDPSQGGVWAEGNILFGGGGSDVIEGRENQDIIDGDSALRVAISVRANPDGTGAELGRTDLMEGKAQGTGSFGPGTAGMTLQQAVFAGLVNPGQLVNVREIVKPDGSLIGASPDRALAGDCPAATNNPATPVDGVVGSTVKLTAAVTNCDTAVFSGEPTLGPDGYTVTANADGSVTVTDIASAALIAAGTPFPKGDGIDTLWNVENLRFCIHNDPVLKTCDAFKDVAAPSSRPPATPTNVTASAIAGSRTSARVAWTEPTGGSAVTSFTIQAFAGTTLARTVTAPATDSTADVTGLTTGTAYTFQVRANGAVTNSPFSVPSAPFTPQPTAPGAPTNVVATGGVAGASVSWVAPADNGGSAILSYKVEALSGTTVIATQTVTAPATSASFGLPAGAVTFRVSATNAVGTGATALSNTVTVLADTTAPTVNSVSPVANAVNVPLGSVIGVTFSEPVQGVTATTFTLRTNAGAAVATTLTLGSGGTSATLTPTAPLVNGTTYRVTLTGGATAIRDLANNALVTTTWTFTARDVVPPTVAARTPAPGATGQAVGTNVVVTFSEPVTVPNNTFTLNQGRTAVRANVISSNGGRTWTLDPIANLTAGRTYTVTLTNGIRDLVGNRFAGATWNFTT
jgi:hypothetical protein